VYDFLFVISELFSLALTVDAPKAKTCQDSMLSGGVCQLQPRFQGEEVVPGEYFLVSTKLDAFCYLAVQTAPCYVLRAVVLKKYQRVTDGRTDRQMELS